MPLSTLGNKSLYTAPLPPAPPLPLPYAVSRTGVGVPQPLPMLSPAGGVVPSSNPMSGNYYAATVPILSSVCEMNPVYKQTVGGAIYEFVQAIVGGQHAPKITGMLIDLPVNEI